MISVMAITLKLIVRIMIPLIFCGINKSLLWAAIPNVPVDMAHLHEVTLVHSTFLNVIVRLTMLENKSFIVALISLIILYKQHNRVCQENTSFEFSLGILRDGVQMYWKHTDFFRR